MEIEIFEEDGDNTLSLDNEHADFTVDVDPESKTYRSRMSLKEDVYFRTQRVEYRISANPIKVEVRLVERLDEPPPDKYAVKDGVVLESEILAQRGDFLTPMTKEFITDLKKEVEWHEESTGDPVSLYLLSKHPEIISPDDYRRHLRQLEERIKTATHKIEKTLKSDKTGLQIIDGEYGRNLWYPMERLEKLDDKELEKLREHASKFQEKLFDEKASEYVGTSEEEFRSGTEILKHIDVFLNKKPASAKQQRSDKVSFGAKFGAFVLQWIWLFLVVSVALWLLSLIITIIQYNFTFAFFVSGILSFLLILLRSK